MMKGLPVGTLLWILLPLLISSTCRGQDRGVGVREMDVRTAMQRFRDIRQLPLPSDILLLRGASYRIARGRNVSYGRLRYAASRLRVETARDVLDLTAYLRDPDGHLRFIAFHALTLYAEADARWEGLPLYAIAYEMESEDYRTMLHAILDAVSVRVEMRPGSEADGRETQ